MSIKLNYDDVLTYNINGRFLILLTEKMKKFIEKKIIGENEMSVYYYDLVQKKLINNVLDSSLINKYISFPYPFYDLLKRYVNIEIKIEHEDKLFEEEIIFNKILSDPQQKLVDNCFEYYNECIKKKEPFTLLISEETGFGKTITTLNLLKKINNKAVIFTKTALIKSAWEEECKDCKKINYFITNSGVSMFDFKKKPSDILIASTNHLTSSVFQQYILNNYGIFIFDEIHNYNLLNNPTSLVAKFINTGMLKKSINITGTPRNNCDIYYGKRISVGYRTNIKNLILFNIMEGLNKVTLNSEELATLQGIIKKPDSYNIRRNSFISINDYERNNTIIDYVQMNSGIQNSRSLILTSSVDHIHKIFDLLVTRFKKGIKKKKIIHESDIYFDKKILILKFLSKKKSLMYDYFEMIKNCNPNNIKYIIITTYQFAGTGTNIPGLNTLFIVCPGINLTAAKQAAGRIMRIQEDNDINVLRSIYIFSMTSISKIFDIKIKKSFNNITENLNDSGWNIINIYERDKYIETMNYIFNNK